MCALCVAFILPSWALAGGKVKWTNGTGKKINIITVVTSAGDCPPQNPGARVNFTLVPNGDNELTLADGQHFCWTWRFDTAPTSEPDGTCRAAADDVITVKAGVLPASKCQEKDKQ